MDQPAPSRFEIEDADRAERKRWVVATLLRNEGSMGMPQLAASVGVSTRVLQYMVHELRTEGEPIGSSSDGFYYIRNQGDYDRTMRQLRSRVISLYESLRGLRRARQRYNQAGELIEPDQGELFDFGGISQHGRNA